MEKDIREQLDVFADYLRIRGLRMTQQRETVVRTFLQTEGHLSTDELHDLVRQREKRIGYATVSRTLKALTDCGLARETDLDDGRTRFEHLYRRPQHHHIVCLECNRTIEFYSPELEQLQERIVEQYQFEAIRNRFQIFGVCSACRGKSTRSGGEEVDTDLIFARDALRIAIETERRGIAFYTAASEIATQPSTKATFQQMLTDEEGHLKGLEKEWNRLVSEHDEVLDAPVFLHFDYDALKRIFPSREEIQRKLNENLTEKQALKLAMQMEQDACNYFREYAEKFNDTKGRDVFLQFAAEEMEHYQIIKGAYDELLQSQD